MKYIIFQIDFKFIQIYHVTTQYKVVWGAALDGMFIFPNVMAFGG